MSQNLTKFLSFALAILIILTLVFIFTRSMKSIEESSSESKAISDIVKPIIDPKDKLPEERFQNSIRKAAHFTEFFILGAEVFLFLTLLFFKNKRNILPGILIGIFFCLFFATVDETIQVISKRGSSVIDIWIDLLGSLTAFVLLFGLNRLFRLLKSKSKTKSVN